MKVGSKDQSVEEQAIRHLTWYMKRTRYIYLKNELLNILVYLTTLSLSKATQDDSELWRIPCVYQGGQF